MKNIRFFLFLLFAAAALQPASAQGLIFRDSVRNVGTISEDDAPRAYRFGYRNTSKEPVVILRVVTTCGCTQPAYSRQPIPAGGEGEVSVTFHPLGRAGALDKALFVYTNQSASRPAATLRLRGAVTPTTDKYIGYQHRMGPLRLRQSSVDFRVVIAPKQRVMRIEVVNAGSRPLRLTALGLPASVKFRTEPELIAPDSVADLVFTLQTAATDQRGPFDLEVYLDGLGEPLVPSKRAIRLRGEVK